MGIGNCQELAGNNAQAASSYEAAARRWPKSPLAYEALMAAGRCYRNAGALDKAEALYKELLDREKTQPAGRADDVKIQLAYVQALRNKF
jgi:TolA-binding protein